MRLARIIGLGRAKELTLLNDHIAPEAALALRRADLDFVIGKLGLTAITLPTSPAKSGAGGSSAGERGAEKERR